MRKKPLLLFTLALLLAPIITWAAPPGWSPLLTPQALAAIVLGDAAPQILRVSGDHGAGHIPGSVAVNYADFRGPASNPGALPSVEALTAALQSLGLEATRPVVLVHDGVNPADMGAATRVYWTLKSFGLQDLAILNGGFRAWQQAELPVSTGPEGVISTNWTPRWRDDFRISTREIERRLDDPALRLVDARPLAFFDGTQSAIARPGTIAGAANLNFHSWFDEARMKHPEELRKILASSSLPDAAQTVSFCNSGHWASINWFVLSELIGVPDTRLYAESMAEWSQSNRPMDNQPSRFTHYWTMTVAWLSGLWEL